MTKLLDMQIAFTVLVFPSLLAAYMGQAAYLLKHPEHVNQAFYKSIPSRVFSNCLFAFSNAIQISIHLRVSCIVHRLVQLIAGTIYWPMFVVATISAIVASQATISATFSIIKQAQALGCFPRVKIVHTSKKMSGQIYIPEINWILMVLCVVITAGFRKTTQIGNAYGKTISLSQAI